MDAERVEKLRERLLFCPICLDEYKDPRILPCHHSVCLDCLLSLSNASLLPTRFFRCPTCRSDVLVPSGGIRSFPPNFFISSLLDEIGCKPYHNRCDLCERSGIHAQFRCVTCDIDVCKFCIARHRLVTHEDESLPLFRLDTKHFAVESFTPEHVCALHTEPMNLYCETCEKSVCLACVCRDHKTHATISMATKSETAQARKHQICQSLLNEEQVVKDYIANATKFSDDVVGKYNETRREILRQRDDLYAVIDKFTDVKLSKVDAEIDRFEKLTCSFKQECNRYHSKVVNLLNFLTEFQQEDLNCDFMSEVDAKMANLAKVKEEFNTVIAFKDLSLRKCTYVSAFGAFGFYFGRLEEKTRRWSCAVKESKLFELNKNYREMHLKSYLRRLMVRAPSFLHGVHVFAVTVLMLISLAGIVNAVMMYNDETDGDDRGSDDPVSVRPSGAMFGVLITGYMWLLFCITLYRYGI